MRPDIPELLILRHGQTEWNRDGRFQGRKDSPLTALGREQAAAQAALLTMRDLTGFAAYVSPQGRAQATAEIALAEAGLQAQTDERLREIDVGGWTGLTRAEIFASNPALNGLPGDLDWYDQAPGGERFVALHARCAAFLAQLTGPAVLITHGITSRALRTVALGRPIGEMAELPGGQGIVHRISDGKHETLGSVLPAAAPIL